MLTIPVSATIAWSIVLATLPRYVRHRSDVRVAAYWHTVALVALALTCSVQPLYETIDHVLRLPNAARWLSNALLLLAAYTIDGFFYMLAHASNTPGTPELPEERQERRRVRLWGLVPLVLVTTGMAALLWRANLHAESLEFTFSRVMPLLVAYRLLFLAYFVFVVLRFIGHAWLYRRITPDASIKVGMGLSVVAGYSALAYAAISILIILTPDTLVVVKAFDPLLNVCIVVTVGFGMIGSTFPLWGRRIGALALCTHLSAVLSYWRLKSLWRAVTSAAPEVVLPTWLTWSDALMHPAEMELLLNRRIIEILDARRALLTPIAPRAAVEAIRTGWRDELPMTDVASPVAGPGRASGQLPHPPDLPDLTMPSRSTVAVSRRELARLARQEALRLGAVLDERRATRDGERQFNATQGNATQRLDPASPGLVSSSPGARGGTERKRNEPLYRPSTFVEQVRYLESVAAALRGLRYRQRARLGGGRSTIGHVVNWVRTKWPQ